MTYTATDPFAGPIVGTASVSVFLQGGGGKGGAPPARTKLRPKE